MSMVVDLVKFFEGGINYIDAKKLSLKELMKLHSEASRINRQIKRNMEKDR